MSSRAVVSFLFLVFLVPVALGFDAATTRQTTGIYVTVEGRGHSLFFDFPSTYAGEGGTFDVPTRFNADLEVWVEGNQLRAGQHRWQFRVEAGDRWTIGRLPKSGADKTTRFLFDVRKLPETREWMCASLTPEPSGDCVILTVQVGDREGTLRIRLREAPAAAPGATEVSALTLERERDRLLEVAAEIEEVRLRRHIWSTLLKTLGDEMLTGAGEAWIETIQLYALDGWMKLDIWGQQPGDQKAVEELNSRLRASDFGTVFENFRFPPSKVGKGGYREFGLKLDIAEPLWRKVTPLAPRHTGRNPQKLGEEILLLQARIAHLAPRAVTDAVAGRRLLLATKRQVGALISDIEPQKPEVSKSGLDTLELDLKVGGSGPGLVDFVRALEDRKEPIRIVLKRMHAAQFGPELTLRLQFLSYRPLSVRDPGMWSMVNSRGRGPDFDETRREYLGKIGKAGDRPYAPPTWSRDPFAKPEPEKEKK